MTTGNGEHDPRIASLEEARRRKAEKEKAAGRAAGVPSDSGSFTSKVLGIAMIAMAVGFIVWLVGGLGGTPAPSGEGQ